MVSLQGVAVLTTYDLYRRGEIVAKMHTGFNVCYLPEDLPFGAYLLHTATFTIGRVFAGPQEHKAFFIERKMQHGINAVLQDAIHIDEHIAATDKIVLNERRVFGNIVPRKYDL